MNRIPWNSSRRSSKPAAGLAMAAAAVLSLSAPARATNPVCNTLTNPVYGIGGSAQTPLVGAIATILANQNPPITVVYAAPSTGACSGISTLLSTSDSFTASASFWTAAGTAETCTAPTTGLAADFAVMGVFADSCPGVTTVPTTIADFAGPVLAWDFIVPGGASGSDQTSISAEAAYLVFGFGAASGSPAVTPWTLPSEIFIRSSTSAAQIGVADTLGIPPAGLLGTAASSNSTMITDVANAATPEDSIGFVSSDLADANRSKVNVLAYQHFGQTCGYWPDSEATAFDKANVRDGQYFPWSQSHVFTFVDSNGNVVVNPTGTGNPTAVSQILNFFQPDTQTVQTITAVIKTGNIPQCAMNAWRESDLGPIESFQPAAPCVGIYEFVATGSTTATACSTNNDCTTADPVCRYGYCEVQ